MTILLGALGMIIGFVIGWLCGWRGVIGLTTGSLYTFLVVLLLEK